MQARLAAVVESSDDAIISKTLDGVIESWNQGAERIFGYTADEIIGKSVLTLIPPDRQDEEPVILERIRNGHRVDHYETIRVTKDGTLIDISLTVSPVKDASGKVVGVSKIARDISSRRKAERAIEELLESERAARHEAEKLSHIKDEFLATLSHELRTPLNAILGWTHLLTKNPGDEKIVQEATEVIERNARLQAQLISDLLDVSRVISGKMRLELQPVWLPPLIERAVEVILPTAESKNIQIETDLETVTEYVKGDPTRLQQIVWNLLSNAVKFTKAGGKISVSLTKLDSKLAISVNDTGKGIRPEFLPRLFDRFSQQDSSAAREHGGLGIGLALVKQLTELHGGTVSASSSGEDRGSTFVVTLPIPAVHPGYESRAEPETSQSLPDPTPPADLPDLTGVRVLVVDDERDALELLRRVLSEAGAIALPANCAEDALQILENEAVDVLVSDIGMPIVDGFQFIKQVRARGHRVPAAALTAFARSADRTKALLAGFQVHIGKPVDPIEFLVNVASLSGRTN